MKGSSTHDIGPKESGTGVGGDTFVYRSLEYRFKIIDAIRFYLSAEARFANEKEWNFLAKCFNPDHGFGFKISILGLPLRLDFGFPYDKRGITNMGCTSIILLE
jgi:outer membrane protein insertion porin family